MCDNASKSKSNNPQKKNDKPAEMPLDGCSLAWFGFVASILLFFISTYLLYETYYYEHRKVDPIGDYVIKPFRFGETYGRESISDTWIIENPYFFVQDENVVKELENWRQTKLVVSETGTFELICPPALLAKRLLIADFDLESKEPRELTPEERENIHKAEEGSIFGHWTIQIDYVKQKYFAFQAKENVAPQRIQFVSVNKEHVIFDDTENRINAQKSSGRLPEGMRLHWSTCTHVEFPQEGVVWKKAEIQK